MADQPYQSLYRRYRPQRFDEVRGQDHVTRALHNAVRDDRVSHAYLFSGPRGTGKTSTARILAKALNCAQTQEGEPCGTCESCIQVPTGSSLDVFEIDAASNRGIDSMRDLIGSTNLGSPGRWKVYIVDEVHMLSKEASAALLKTLEEPPSHVIFVLATTDPQKVLPTIRSRTQHYEFRLLPPEVLAGLVADINADAGLAVDAHALEQVVRRGRGSARDALSVLDQVAASGEVDDDDVVSAELVAALAERDAGAALAAVARACAAGHDPRVVATDLLERLRNAFLAVMAPDLVPATEAAAAISEGSALGPPGLVRAMDAVGAALADMREALEPRVALEVALVRIARPDVDASPAALLERIERLEKLLEGGAPPAASAPPPTAPPPATPPPAAPSSAAPTTPPAPAPRKAAPHSPSPTPVGPPATAPAGAVPSRDDLTKAWGDSVLAGLSKSARARLRVGRFLAVEEGVALFALPNQPHCDMSEPFRVEFEAALSAHFGTRVPLRLVVDSDQGPSPSPSTASPASPTPTPEEESIERHDLVDAGGAGSVTAEDVVRQAFPGAEEVPAS